MGLMVDLIFKYTLEDVGRHLSAAQEMEQTTGIVSLGLQVELSLQINYAKVGRGQLIFAHPFSQSHMCGSLYI